MVLVLGYKVKGGVGVLSELIGMFKGPRVSQEEGSFLRRSCPNCQSVPCGRHGTSARYSYLDTGLITFWDPPARERRRLLDKPDLDSS